MVLRPGDKAPDFQLPGSDGNVHRLSDYTGKTVILYFYPKDHTPGCTKEACAFRDFHPSFAELETVVLGVSKDTLSSHNKFIASFALPFLLLSDPETVMMQAYGAYGEKITCGRTSLGTIRSTVIVAPDGMIRKVWPLVKKAEEHPAAVLAYLRGEDK